MKFLPLLLSFVIIIFCLNFVTAFEFDNSLRYEKDDMKVTIENVWGLPIFGSDLGTVELKSHKSVNHILHFGFGKEEVVMYYDFEGWELYENGLGEVYFLDRMTGKQIQKDYYFVERKLVDVEVNDYSEQCEQLENKTKVCHKVISGTHLEQKLDWVRLNNKDITKENRTIGLKTYVAKGDFIDAVWTIAGQKIEKHSSWTANLDVGSISYWNLDENSGDAIDLVGIYNGTLENTPTQGVSGKINQSYSFLGASEERVVTTNFPNMTGGVMTVCAWFKSNSATAAPLISSWEGSSQESWVLYYNGDGKVAMFIDDAGGGKICNFCKRYIRRR